MSLADIKSKWRSILSDHLDPFLADRGFRRKGTDYSKPGACAIQHLFFRFDLAGPAEARCYYFANIEMPAVERLLNYGADDSQAVNTVGKQMGYIRPPLRFEEWRLDRKTNPSALASRFIEDITQHAIPFLDKYSEPLALAVALRSGDLFNLDIRDASLKLAAIEYLEGHQQEALKLLADRVRESAGKPHEVHFLRLQNYLASLTGASWTGDS